MKHTVLILLWLVCGLVAFVAIALNREAFEPYLLQIGLDPEGNLFTRGVLKALAIVLFGAPLGALLWLIAGMGSDSPGTDVHGYRLLRLRAGSRWFFSIASAALACLFLFVATEDSDNLIFQGFMIAFGLAFLFGAFWLFAAKIRYDNSTIYVTEYTGASRRHDWADLEKIEVNQQAMEYHLIFRTGRKARVSFMYQGVDDLMALAWDKLNGITDSGRTAAHSA